MEVAPRLMKASALPILFLAFFTWLPVAQAIDINVDSGCTLLQALISANGNVPIGGNPGTGGCEIGSGTEADTIILTTAGPHYHTSVLNVGNYANPAAANAHVTIQGNGHTITGDSQQDNNDSNNHQIFIVKNNGSLTLENVTLSKGRAVSGGAIRVENGGNLTVRDSVIRDNVATGSGGGINVDEGGSAQTVTIERSAFLDNSASGDGGAIQARGTVTLNVSDSTFGSNVAGSEGGAIYLRESNNHNLVANLTHISIVSNRASAGTGGGLHVSSSNSPTVNLRNSLLALSYQSSIDCVATGGLSQNTGNYIDTGLSCGSPYTASQHGSPNLGALSGTYYPLQAGSPAIDAANANHCTATDQIGTARPRGNACDIGAIESSFTASTGDLGGDSGETGDGGNPNSRNVGFSYSPAGDKRIRFDASPASGPGLSYSWDFGDGDSMTTSQSSNTHQYSDYGNYDVSLTVTGNAPVQRTVAVRPPGSGDDDDDDDADDDEPTATPGPRTCDLLPDSILVTGGSPSTQCQRIDAGGVGIQSVIDLGIVDAVDVWSWFGGQNVQVCFRNSGGAVMFLDAAYSPRAVSQLAHYSLSGLTCAAIAGHGSVVLVSQSPAAPASASQPPVSGSAANLNAPDCRVTLNDILNFRAAPGGAILFELPAFVTLSVVDSAPGWYKVDWYGQRGWVSADYVTRHGDCG